MGDKSKIQWTEATWNPITGCTRVSAGCQNCYAEKETRHQIGLGTAKYQGLLNDQHRFNGVVKFHEEALMIPLKRKKPTTYFVNSMSDLFHENVKDEWIDKVFAVMALCPQHTFQVLTKRAERLPIYCSRFIDRGSSGDDLHTWASEMAHWACEAGLRNYEPDWDEGDNTDHVYEELLSAVTGGALPNLWLGTSVENQKAADERIPHLLATPAAVRFLSVEPLLGEVNLTKIPLVKNDDNFANATLNALTGHVAGPDDMTDMKVDWIIVGGESGPSARACNVEWIRSIVRQCKAADVPVFVKQLGKLPIDRNDSGFDGDEPTDWQAGTDATDWPDGSDHQYQGAPVRVHLANKKGGDISEWPADLQIREFPK